MGGLRFGLRSTLAGTTSVGDGGTATLIAARGAGITWALGDLVLTGSGGSLLLVVQDSAGNELFTVRKTGAETIPLSFPAGIRPAAANRALQVVNNSGATRNVGAVALYRDENA